MSILVSLRSLFWFYSLRLHCSLSPVSSTSFPAVASHCFRPKSSDKNPLYATQHITANKVNYSMKILAHLAATRHVFLRSWRRTKRCLKRVNIGLKLKQIISLADLFCGSFISIVSKLRKHTVTPQGLLMTPPKSLFLTQAAMFSQT